VGTGFYFLGESSHSPVDVREDEMRRIDNQIDVLSKTFLGLTVACARCHDHKFDPITSKDYYALSGYLHSSRYQQAFVDSPDRRAIDLRRLRALKDDLIANLRDVEAQLPVAFQRWLDRLTRVRKDEAPSEPLRTVVRPPTKARPSTLFEDFNGHSFSGWSVTGDAFGDRPSQNGDFRLAAGGQPGRLVPVKAGLAHSGLSADRLQGVIRSPSFTIEARYVHHLVAGRGGRINVVIDNYEKIRDPIYGGLTIRVDHGDELRWVTQDLGMWLGHTAYLEIADGAAVDYGGTTSHLDDGLGYIAVDEIRLSDRPAPEIGPRESAEAVQTLDLDSLIAALGRSKSAKADKLLAVLNDISSIEARLPEPVLALAIADGSGQNEHVHIRGNYKNLGDVVPRRFLDALGGSGSSSSETGSGRLDLAHRMVDPTANPLLARVLVNRLWKHHFGEGIVKSTDDFGAMGQKPSHPDLLDWLSSELLAQGWSIKSMQRLLVNSSTYRMSSAKRDDADRLDPSNVYLHRMNVRRLEAETIRDTILSASGRLTGAMYGPGVPVHLTGFMDGRGRPARSGPLDGDGRRSIYSNVRRNFLDPVLLAFDAPVPFSTMGRRNVSNVPAQALALLNDPLVISQAKVWAERELAAPCQSPRARVERLYITAFGRPATEEEARASLTFIAEQVRAHQRGQPTSAEAALFAWSDFCHVLMNVKAFIFID
jgi:hypothetical protein